MTIKDKILVIEDEQNISNFISAILTANGYDVLVARNGTIAETMIASHCPDIIILDLGLPDMDGMQILRRVRAWSKIPIVVVSARSHEQDKVAALDAGADDYLTKPFGTEELLARIRAAVRHTRTPIGSESVAGRINVFATAITCGMTVSEINELDLVYAPPVAPVYDPILIAASQAMKKVEG